MYKNQHIIAVIPARDEALSIAGVIEDIRALSNADQTDLFDRILVCDNASLDNTAEIASLLGAEVVHQALPGYGIACLTALSQIEETDIVVFIDADASLQIDEAKHLLVALDTGADLAIGARRREWQERYSMTLPQRFGNKLASTLIQFIWHESLSDLGPFRAIRFNVLQQLEMQDLKFGWTVEMQIKAIQHGFITAEVPVHYRRRIGRSKISGTIGGVLSAGYGIITTILKLTLNPPRQKKQVTNRNI